MRAPRLALLVLVSLLAACAGWRWSGSPAPTGGSRDSKLHGIAADESRHPAPRASDALPDAAVALSTYAVHALPAPVPLTPESRAAAALYYSDMGPDAVDVSAYPAQQRHDYAIFAAACARCHTLARSINAPLVARGWWEFYMLGMRMRSSRAGRPLSPDETKAILDFLEYDSRVRKVENARDFDALTEELKSRFDASVAERLKRLQKRNERTLSPAGR